MCARVFAFQLNIGCSQYNGGGSVVFWRGGGQFSVVVPASLATACESITIDSRTHGHVLRTSSAHFEGEMEGDGTRSRKDSVERQHPTSAHVVLSSLVPCLVVEQERTQQT